MQRQSVAGGTAHTLAVLLDEGHPFLLCLHLLLHRNAMQSFPPRQAHMLKFTLTKALTPVAKAALLKH
jgi:hypothetical protein